MIELSLGGRGKYKKICDLVLFPKNNIKNLYFSKLSKVPPPLINLDISEESLKDIRLVLYFSTYSSIFIFILPHTIQSSSSYIPCVRKTKVSSSWFQKVNAEVRSKKRGSYQHPSARHTRLRFTWRWISSWRDTRGFGKNVREGRNQQQATQVIQKPNQVKMRSIRTTMPLE